MTIPTLEGIPLITLVGQPNSGKTSLFNHLSGKKFKTVNYPGSTVQYSISKILSKYEINANILDSPGIISLIPSSPDEKISVDSLFSHPKFGTPDIVAVTVDASQLSRHLFLVKQLLDAKFKVVIVLTMVDILHKKKLEISDSKLSEILGCKIVRVNGQTGNGIDNLLKVLNEEIGETNLDEKSELSRPVKRQTSHLLDTYNAIEKIQNEVLFLKQEGNENGKIDLEKINEQLVVLNSPRNFNRPDELTLKLDKFVLHKFWGLITFFLIMSVTFTSIFWLASPLMDLINDAFSLFSQTATDLLGDNWFSDLISDGIITGIGSVMVFLPQILILFLILGLLEDSGYLARGAMLVDKPLSKIGLNGKSFVPMLSGFACAIPAIMATRTITNRRERLLTIFIIPLMSCSARLPVYALLIAFLTPSDKPYIGGIVLSLIYIFSILSSVVIAGVINKLQSKGKLHRNDSSFILELPTYKKPKLGIVASTTVKNAKQYIYKAGPVIFYLSIALWIFTYFPNYNPSVQSNNSNQEELSQLKNSERISTSYAAYAGKFVEPVMKPIGLDWRVGVSLIATFAAREVFVSSLALIFKITDNSDDLQNSILTAMRDATFDGTDQKVFTTASTAGLIIFFVFALQCLSTVAISKKETGSWKIPILQIVVFTSLAYILSLITFNGLRAFGIN